MGLLFKDRHIPMIRAGEKRATRRMWSDEYARPNEGTVQMAKTSLFESDDECDCYIRILQVYQEPLAEMSAQDFDAEGGYTPDEFVEIWRGLYGEWDPEQVVEVVEFEYVGDSRPEGDDE